MSDCVDCRAAEPSRHHEHRRKPGLNVVPLGSPERLGARPVSICGDCMSESGLESGNSVLIQVDGAHGLVRLSVTQAALGGLSVGSFVEIDASEGFAIALVTALETADCGQVPSSRRWTFSGKFSMGRDGQVMFQRGVSHYPLGRAVRQADRAGAACTDLRPRRSGRDSRLAPLRSTALFARM